MLLRLLLYCMRAPILCMENPDRLLQTPQPILVPHSNPPELSEQHGRAAGPST